MGVEVKRITNGNVYLEGKNLLGKVEEAKLPDVVATMAEHKALGLIGKLELPSGLDKMDMTLKFNSFYEDVLIKTGNPFKTVQLQVRSSLETYTGQGRTAEVAVVTYITGTFKKFPLGGYKQHDNVDIEHGLNVVYLKQVINGKDIIEVDVLANIFKVGGEDILANYRNNIGG